MSTQVPIGNVGFIPLGDYIEGTLYQRLHVVRHDNNLYCCLRETTEMPTIGSDDWMLLIEGTNTPSGSAAIIDVNFGDLTEFQNIPTGTNITYLFPEEFLVLLRKLKNNVELPPYIFRFRFKENNTRDHVFNVDFRFNDNNTAGTLEDSIYGFDFRIPESINIYLKVTFPVNPAYPGPIITKVG